MVPTNAPKNIKVTLDVPPSDDLKSGGSLEVTFLPTPSAASLAGDDDVLEGIARVGPALRNRASGLIDRLKALEPQVMGWMNADPENARLFATDPMAALRSAGVEEPLVAELEALARDLAQGAGGIGG